MQTTFPANLKYWCDFHGEPLFLFYDERDGELQPVVRHGDRDCHNAFDALALIAPDDEAHTALLAARIANFILFEAPFQLIEDPDGFKTRYQQALQQRAETPEQAHAHYAPYQTDEIEVPQRNGVNLVFYNSASHNLVPFRVTVPWPLTSRQTPIRQELLPLAPDGGDYVAD